MNYNPYMNYSMMQSMQQPQQIQNGGFVSVRGIEEARRYPVAAGNSVTFKDETAPYVYTKTMGFSQLDRPLFEVFRLVKEETQSEGVSTDYRTEIENIKAEITKIKKQMEVAYGKSDVANDKSVQKQPDEASTELRDSEQL